MTEQADRAVHPSAEAEACPKALPWRLGPRRLLAAIASIGAAVVVSCSPAPLDQRAVRAQTQFGPEAKRAARALSIGNRDDLMSAGTQYEKAVLCDLALASALGRLRASGVLSAVQVNAMSELKAAYLRRIETFAAAEKRPADLIDEDRKRLSTTLADPRLRMQYALGCLRQTASTMPAT